MERLGPIINLKDFKLPKLVVIGNQNRGKSSLLESITKCPIFPRGDDTTTRAPIRLQLQHVESSQQTLIQVSWKNQQPRKLDKPEDIVGAVREMMARIDKDAVEADEVLVQIHDPAVISIEFIDLPGIVAAPSHKKQLTEGLVQKYLRDEESMFLCVEEATCGNLDGCQAVGLVREAAKTQHTIMVLTKSDTLTPDLVKKRLISRLLRRSGEVTDQDFAGCVAVINRSHHDHRTLLEAGQEEEQTFERQVFDRVERMPKRMDELPPAIQRNLCLDNLISQVEAMYRNFIVKEWRPKALHRLQPMLADAALKLNNLGQHPATLTIPEVMEAIANQLDFALMAYHLRPETNTGQHPAWTLTAAQPLTMPIENIIGPQRPQTPQFAQVPLRFLGTSLLPQPPGSLEEAVQLKGLVTAAMAAIDSWLQRAAYLGVVQHEIKQAFMSRHKMQLSRFSSLEEEICQHGLQRAVDIQLVRDNLLQRIQPMASNYQLLPDLSGKLAERLETAALTHILQEVIEPLRQGRLRSCVPDAFPLEEHNLVHQQRKGLEAHLGNLQHAFDVISNIDAQVDDAQPSSG